MIAFEMACRSGEKMKLIEFEQLLPSLPEARRKSKNPGRWDVSMALNGAGGTLGVVPDKIIAIERTNTPESWQCFFPEADRGTMPVKRENLCSNPRFIESFWPAKQHGIKARIERS